MSVRTGIDAGVEAGRGHERRGTLGRASRSERRAGRAFEAMLLACLGFGLLVLAVLLYDVITTGWSRFNLDLVQGMPSGRPARAGIQSAMMGTIWVISLVALITVPLGIATAVYLEEYANPERWFNRAVELNIQNLAAVPSIVYGILGLAFFNRGLGFGGSVLAVALTLSLLVLPIVIISCREAIRSIPTGIKEGALALGATRLQTVRRTILPNAIPGTATGSILALSRAIGEAAPVLLVAGGLVFITFNPEGVLSQTTVLPVQIFNYVSRPQEEFRTVAAAAILVLLLILLVMNSAAIFIRNRFQRKW
ncbi:MAG TPA: phosphate ABC transporter permease PstA [Mycobacteriales bacterium]|nr:phosphate ABC transporter permease PstA [Mycobacteriales bacterium]